MAKDTVITYFFLIFNFIPFGTSLMSDTKAIPGTFFWKPRLGLDLAVPTSASSRLKPHQISENIINGNVLLEGYQAGITVIAIASGLSGAAIFPHLNLQSAYYYTNTYRWMLRYFSLIPSWIGGRSGNYCETHKVWNKRFHHIDEFVPNWLRSLLFFVKKHEWENEEKEFEKFQKYSVSGFNKHYQQPNKFFNDFKSQVSQETAESINISSAPIRVD